MEDLFVEEVESEDSWRGDSNDDLLIDCLERVESKFKFSGLNCAVNILILISLHS